MSALADLPAEIVATLERLVAEARASGDSEPTAMNLATVDAEGRVAARIVLLKGVAADGLRFFTNYSSAKGAALAAHAQAALTFHWKTLGDQVQARFEGIVATLTEADSDAYFATRPRESQLGAWASLQSQPLPDRATFEARYAEFERRFEGAAVPRPPHWGGYRLSPDRVEFWYGARYRLHERVVHVLSDGVWQRGLLYP
ncbi:MAG TPA: pyridoxamine 5'-phosphate oxidase [Dokdonella sp.]|uniref:pyridoxamine 5'-phosphate oxidase n=1 Tax=Dokdonella sp. TaxID=2291710 RepID=UPI0025BBD52E|nr:pyridoxamine 5'-phosphate oxidase [Dokdonella sp.]MBX3690884.1 pyridoxamine 5'-phosphate oxidase [Dokdonella sp.]MCW5569371.1 pyridoxamine 5'-phosphate oxidase [Dokdonella sp.]HNR91400.1 pyridoxamine 5'-phosphate oxidase [Dokdonella sp.]